MAARTGGLLLNTSGPSRRVSNCSLQAVASAGADVALNADWRDAAERARQPRIDLRTGKAARITVRGGDVANADGLVLRGRTLLVVQNRSNSVARLRLSGSATAARLQGVITDSRFQVPSTADFGPGNGLYLVNAEFGTPPSDAVPYEIVRVRLPR